MEVPLAFRRVGAWKLPQIGGCGEILLPGDGPIVSYEYCLEGRGVCH